MQNTAGYGSRFTETCRVHCVVGLDRGRITFGTTLRPAPLKGLGAVALVCSHASIVFTPAQTNRKKGENKEDIDLTGLKSAGVKTPVAADP